MHLERKLTSRQHKAMKQLIRNECCNYYDELCLKADRPCMQIESRSLRCRWFYEAVLPRDKSLREELEMITPTPTTSTTSTPKQGDKRCAICGQGFTPTNNRATYCRTCAANTRREQKRRCKQKRRGKEKQIPP